MSWKHVLEAFDLLDSPAASGEGVAELWRSHGADEVFVKTVSGERGATDFVRIVIPGSRGRLAGGDAPTLGLIGRLGGLGARPEKIGFVSDGDGALTIVAAAAKLLEMAARGDRLDGDVVLATHIDPDAPTQPHDPVPFMNSSIEMSINNQYEVTAEMEAIISVDTTKGNRICNHRGFAVTPTIKEGWILRVPESLLDVAERTSGRPAMVMPITMQDITPYGNGIYHMNSIVQPCTATTAPVVGLAITTETAVAGSATGATDLTSVESAVRFVIEAAKDFGRDNLSFFDVEDFDRLQQQYGSMSGLQVLHS
ncbi:DUF1177 domain-containing protein [Psychromicrobium xiongbiense]|uniref:DUF1177 domain-containing protein n=1 Tax=Psychromicrobium xiongbiense TaxID=3051184 RepID=UPI002555BCBC|nr:DUF1177 domain-containing protein [Psychromicrobium sp. YIM S02556]